MKYLRIAGQLIVVAAVVAAVAALADWPVYRQIPPGDGLVILSFVHSGGRPECRRLTPQEIAKLPPNMRRVQECPRGRRPLHVELDVDARRLYKADLPPTGIAGDGPSRVYQRFVLPAGEHTISVRMRESDREGFDYQHEARTTLAPDQLLVIDFRPEAGGFLIR